MGCGGGGGALGEVGLTWEKGGSEGGASALDATPVGLFPHAHHPHLTAEIPGSLVQMIGCVIAAVSLLASPLCHLHGCGGDSAFHLCFSLWGHLIWFQRALVVFLLFTLYGCQLLIRGPQGRWVTPRTLGDGGRKDSCRSKLWFQSSRVLCYLV